MTPMTPYVGSTDGVTYFDDLIYRYDNDFFENFNASAVIATVIGSTC